jgi:SOS-response transcriptional repressor LexA
MVAYMPIPVRLKQSEFAKKIGLDRVTLNRIIHGKINPTITTLQKIAKGLGKSLEYFDEDFNPFRVGEEKVPYGFRRLPLLSHIPIGVKRWAKDDVSEWIDIPTAFVGKHKCMFLVKAVGDSMEGAGIFDGDLIAAACDKEVTNGCIVVTGMGEEASIRRYRELKDKIRLEPANPKYASEEYDSKNQIGIKGVVVWSGRKH